MSKKFLIESPNIYAYDSDLDPASLANMKKGEFVMRSSQRYDEAYPNKVTFIIDEKTRCVMYAGEYEFENPEDNTHYALVENVREGNDEKYVTIPSRLTEEILDRVNLMYFHMNDIYKYGLFGRLAWNENGVVFLSFWCSSSSGATKYEKELKQLLSDLRLSWDNLVVEIKQEGMAGPYTCMRAKEYFGVRHESITLNELKRILWK